jgi:hypothetical protein
MLNQNSCLLSAQPSNNANDIFQEFKIEPEYLLTANEASVQTKLVDELQNFKNDLQSVRDVRLLKKKGKGLAFATNRILAQEFVNRILFGIFTTTTQTTTTTTKTFNSTAV